LPPPAMAPACSKVILDTLPNEIVCFYKSHRRFASLYGTEEEEEEKFWEQTCWLAGIGLIRGETPHLRTVVYDTWRKIAIRCIEEDGFCEFPHCGSAVLDSNAEAMEKCIEAGYIPYKKPAEVDNPSGADQWQGFDFHGMLICIGFVKQRSKSTMHFYADVELDAYIELDPEGDELPYTFRDSIIAKHQLAARSFATFPPVPVIHFRPLIGMEIESAERSTGVTVEGVINALHDQLDEELDGDELDYYMESVPEFFEDWLKENDSGSDDGYGHRDRTPKFTNAMKLRKIRTLRDVLAIDRWYNMDFEKFTDRVKTDGVFCSFRQQYT